MTFYSPITGFVTDRKAFPQTSVTSGYGAVHGLRSLHHLGERRRLRIRGPVRAGRPIAELQLSYYPGKKWTGSVRFIYPTVDPTTRTLKVRMEFPNPEFELKPQMFADVQLKVDYGSKIVVPQEAVLDSGNEQIVFVVHDGGYFEPRKITMGPQFDGSRGAVGVEAGREPSFPRATS